MNNSCTCDICKVACTQKPGWFLPTEAAEAAESVGETVEQFFHNYLGVDWWETEDGPIFVIAPATENILPGSEYSSYPGGECVFHSEGDCLIHSAKPYECRQYIHSNTNLEIVRRHKFVALMWKHYQEEIVALLGRQPHSDLDTGL